MRVPEITNLISGFFTDIANFFHGRSVLGVDIGTTSVKVAELGERGGNLALTNYGILEAKEYLIHPNKAIQTSSLPIDERGTAELLKVLLREMKPKSKLAIASIPAFSAFATVIDMPLLSPAETAKAVLFQAPQYIPMPVDEVTIDWVKVDEFEDDSRSKLQHIFVVGISRSLIQKYKGIFKEAGLRLTSLEFDGFSLTRGLTGSRDAETMIVDIGAEETDIFVTGRRRLEYVGGTDYSGIHLTQSVARSLGITVARAEELKRRRGLASEGPESELSTLTVPFLDVIIQEVNHVRDVYKRRYGRDVVAIMLIGGGANLIGIGKYFSRQTGLTEVKQTLFAKVSYDVRLEPVVRQLENELPTAVGLAERYFE